MYVLPTKYSNSKSNKKCMLLISAKNRVDKHKCLRSEKQLDLLMGLQHGYNAWNALLKGS